METKVTGFRLSHNVLASMDSVIKDIKESDSLSSIKNRSDFVRHAVIKEIKSYWRKK